MKPYGAVLIKDFGLRHLVYLAPVPLHSPSQRPHHFVQWVHEQLHCQVWWVEPYPVRLPRRNDLRRLRTQGRSALGPTWSRAPWLHVCTVPSVPIEPLPLGSYVLSWMQQRLRSQLRDLLKHDDSWLAIGRPSGMALALCQAVHGERVLYDVMDDMPQFSQGLSRRWMQHMHTALLAQAQVVWGSSARIVQAVQAHTRHPPALVRNGTIAMESAICSAPHTQGIGTAAHAEAPLVLGYVGTIAAWFDWHAVCRLAQALPQARIEIYGPQESPIATPLPTNVQLHGPVPHAQVFALMRSWHAGLIPFVHNTLTQSVDPVKYYEYRACGLPVITTLFGEMPHHAAADDGVWPMESLPLEQLESLLRHWHQQCAQRQAQGLSLAPDCLQQASWPSRFTVGAMHCGWIH